MSGRMRSLFRRMTPVKVITEKGNVWRRGVIAAVDSTDVQAFETARYGKLTLPLYRYFGDAKELLDGDAELEAGAERYTVLWARAAGVSDMMYIEALLERQVTADDGQ